VASQSFIGLPLQVLRCGESGFFAFAGTAMTEPSSYLRDYLCSSSPNLSFFYRR
jgi:hypothetical protein